jgi:hypothetical protein
VEPASKLTYADRRAIHANKSLLLMYLADLPITPAESIVATCRRHGIALTLDEEGALRIGMADGSEQGLTAWPSLLMAIEAHLPAIIELVAAGWHLWADAKASAA